MHEIFSMLVIESKLIPIDYFMDKMLPWEVSNILDKLDYCDRLDWERTRMMMYVIAQTNSTKKLSPKDILNFAWDNTKEHETTIANEDIQRLRQKVKMIQNSNV